MQRFRIRWMFLSFLGFAAASTLISSCGKHGSSDSSASSTGYFIQIPQGIAQ